MMKIVFMGTPDFAVPTLKALISRHQVAAVVTQPDRKKGRGKKVQYSPVKETALEYKIPVYQPNRVKEEEFQSALREIAPDVIVVAAFGQILPESILNLPKYGCINVHASLLPRYRGAAPIQWAVINGEKESGVTIMYMEKGLDTGDMLGKTVVPIEEKETGASLHDKLAQAGGPLLLEILDQIEKGSAVRIKQKDEESTYAGMLTKEMGQIRWSQDAASIECLIRGLNSWPCAFTDLEGKTLKIWDADVIHIDENGYDALPAGIAWDQDILKTAEPGRIAAVSKDCIYVVCGRDILALKEVQAPGKKRMTVEAFLRGHAVEVGTLLGGPATSE